ncbi:MAG: hypothetical protein ABSB82_12355 [Terriglobia bacterium]|jgi:hypothetical protein
MGTPFTLQIHPDAAKNFDEKGEALLSLVSAVPVDRRQLPFQPDIHPRANPTEKEIIGEIEIGLGDYRGNQAGRVFEQDGKTFGLVGQGFNNMVTLATRLQETQTVRPYVSVRCLMESSFQWVKKRYRGEIGGPLTAHVLSECAQKIETAEIWLPLFHVYIQNEFSVGKIKFKTLTGEMLDRYQERALECVPEEGKVAVKMHLDRDRSKFQGSAAATIEVTAEPLRAQEIASEEADYSIAALRFFHPANQTPFFRSFCTISGAENLSTSSTLVVREGVIQQWSKAANLGAGSTWFLPSQEITMLQKVGLNALSQLLANEKRSSFQNELLDALLIYSRNSLFDDPVNRLVHILAAVESILLRDNNEPIQKNIGERLAFVVGVTPEERMAIRDNATRVYGLRSAFLHHGRAFDEMDALENFMGYVWRGFVALIYDQDKFRSKEELVEALERRKME